MKKYTFHFSTVGLATPGTPVPRHRTIAGVNQLDAKARLRRILHREGLRIHLIHAVECEKPEAAPTPHPEYIKALDIAKEARELISQLEEALA